MDRSSETQGECRLTSREQGGQVYDCRPGVTVSSTHFTPQGLAKASQGHVAPDKTQVWQEHGSIAKLNPIDHENHVVSRV